MEDPLKKSGLKNTLARRKILDLLETASQHHLSAETIYDHLRTSGFDIGLATIYRVLAQFEEAGLVHRHNFESGQSVFELERGSHHDHLVCTKCGLVEEFVDELIEQRQQEIAARSGYQMTNHQLNIFGVCAQCQSESLTRTS